MCLVLSGGGPSGDDDVRFSHDFPIISIAFDLLPPPSDSSPLDGCERSS